MARCTVWVPACAAQMRTHERCIDFLLLIYYYSVPSTVVQPIRHSPNGSSTCNWRRDRVRSVRLLQGSDQPTATHATLVTIVPYRLGMGIMSNCVGIELSCCMEQLLLMIISTVLVRSNSWISRHVSRKQTVRQLPAKKNQAAIQIKSYYRQTQGGNISSNFWKDLVCVFWREHDLITFHFDEQDEAAPSSEKATSRR